MKWAFSKGERDLLGWNSYPTFKAAGDGIEA
jgi:hypothetical protein